MSALGRVKQTNQTIYTFNRPETKEGCLDKIWACVKRAFESLVNTLFGWCKKAEVKAEELNGIVKLPDDRSGELVCAYCAADQFLARMDRGEKPSAEMLSDVIQGGINDFEELKRQGLEYADPLEVYLSLEITVPQNGISYAVIATGSNQGALYVRSEIQNTFLLIDLRQSKVWTFNSECLLKLHTAKHYPDLNDQAYFVVVKIKDIESDGHRLGSN